MNKKVEEIEILDLDEIEEINKKMNEKKSSNKKEKKKMKTWKKVVIVLSSLFVFGMGSGLFLLYGPWAYVRELLITTAMTTLNHQYLATWFYSDETINKVLEKHKVIESGESTNPDLIDISKPNFNSGIYKNKYEKEVLTKEEGNDLYKVIPISGNSYKGYLVAVYDPSKVKLASTRHLGNRGEAITALAKNNKATIAINAGGFADQNWMGTGGNPRGIVIKDSKVIWNESSPGMGGGIVGMTKDNKLVLTREGANKALQMGVRDAVEFGPFLVVNGKKSFVQGNGGWGIAPRTAIGQREDGIILFLIIDGRRTHSIGADMDDLTEIMYNYGAINAANMDGGSSTALVVKDKIINTPVASGPNGLRDIANAWVVVE